MTLYVPSASAEAAGPILVHDGPSPGPPELVDLRAAAEFHRSGSRDEGGDASAARWVPSREERSLLLRLPAVDSLLGLPGSSRREPGHRARRRTDQLASPPMRAAWLGLVFDHPAARADAASLESLGEEWNRLLALGSALSWHAQQDEGLPNDPTTGLPSRIEFQVTLARSMEQAQATGKALTLLLINPDEFAEVNERFGREAGDTVVREIADRIRSSLRSSDMVSKYGGAVFAAILTDTLRPEGKGVAEKLLPALTEGAYLKGALRLGFSVGAAVYDPADTKDHDALGLIRQADQALHTAKRSGGSQIVIWQQDAEMESVENLDRLSGIFTANMTKDYRNMMLLWDTVSVVAGSADFTGLARQAVARMYETFKARRIGLFRWSDTGDPLLVHGQARPLTATASSAPVTTFSLEESQRRLLEDARSRGEVLVADFRDDSGSAGSAYAIPLIAGDDCLGCLYLDGRADALALDSSDLIFVKALAGQLAVAFDRARLAEQERLRLHRELKGLRQALHESRLVYCSPQMEEVISTVRRVAPTDATVLISGESGTGKELMARTIHELSTRRGSRLVIVDCAAIAETLIDSELFGYERGAFTGARQRSVGRLAEADAGTVLLDEIGELPLEVQSKLLRFVQEKQFTPVGGTRPRSVDVRVIAATNRDLPGEVAAGRFREDLYYRLNVVRLVVPPLRERPDDILFLATHWLERYSVQYHKPVKRISPEAQAQLVAYAWPGNVRELQNRIMQAVILCEGEELRPSEIRLGEDGTGPAVLAGEQPASISSAPSPPSPRPPEPAGGSSERSLPAHAPAAQNPWRELGDALGRQVDAVLGPGNGPAVPMGKWLEDELVLEAYEAARGLFRGGAELLGVPETTFRRKLHKARATAEAGLSVRTPGWEEVRPAIAGVVRAAEEDSSDLLRRAREILLDEVDRRLPQDAKRASGLLGVTPQTYRRWQQERADSH